MINKLINSFSGKGAWPVAYRNVKHLVPGASLVLVMLLASNQAFSQELPIGTWRTHVSFESVHSVAISPTVVYGASQQGVLLVDRDERAITSLTKLDGLTGSAISFIAYDNATQALIVAYEEGTFDLVAGNAVTRFDPFLTTPITTSRRIWHISIRNELAYFSADYGVLVFDLEKKEIKETWRDLSSAGEVLAIYQSTFLADSIFLATANGVLAGNLQDNLLDFSKWKRFDVGDFSGVVKSISSINNIVYAAIDGLGVYRYQTGNWQLQPYLQGNDFRMITSSEDFLFIPTQNEVWQLDQTNVPQQLVSDQFVAPTMVAMDSDGDKWIADASRGLISDYSGSLVPIVPNGPSAAQTFRMKYTGKKLFRLNGGYSNALASLNRPGNVDQFDVGQWSTVTTELKDLSDIELVNGSTCVAAYGIGLNVTDGGGNTTLYNTANSTMPNLNITAIEKISTGLLVATYGSPQSMHLFKPDQTWQGFTALATVGRYPMEMVEDFLGRIWMVVNPAQGGGLYVVDLDANAYVYKNDIPGTGALPSKNVRAIAVDRSGLVWVGTDIGAAYFFSANNDAIKPIFENRFLLRDDKVTAIAIDGGDRKWMGTERGAWLFNPIGEDFIYRFTTDNSPLLSNNILDIEIHGETGEVFFVTDKGISSFRADASDATNSFQEVKIFPNPVTDGFNGSVGITGLATDAGVKITDISGKLVWQGNANGGTATWNVRDYTGRGVAAGVYVIFSALPDGTESIAGKIVVVR